MNADSSEEILQRAVQHEREANRLRAEGKGEESFKEFCEAAGAYGKVGQHSQAALCFTSAASCWNIFIGEHRFHNAAKSYEQAAWEWMKAGRYDYARERFGDAALSYEKEGDAGKYSSCFYESKIAEQKLALQRFIRGKEGEETLPSKKVAFKERFFAFCRWVVNLLNYLAWGYGERPFRTFFIGGLLVIGCAFVYYASGQISHQETVGSVSFREAFYLSIITYTTVGFGDYLPVGWTQIVAMLEASVGIFLAPLFLIGLTRRYLRMYR